MLKWLKKGEILGLVTKKITMDETLYELENMKVEVKYFDEKERFITITLLKKVYQKVIFQNVVEIDKKIEIKGVNSTLFKQYMNKIKEAWEKKQEIEEMQAAEHFKRKYRLKIFQ